MAILLLTQSYVQLYILYQKKPVRATNSALETRKSLKIYSYWSDVKAASGNCQTASVNTVHFFFPKKSDRLLLSVDRLEL